MQQAVLRLAILPLLVAFALLVGTSAGSPPGVSAAPADIDPTSCGGAGLLYCSFESDGADVVIGAGSCTVADSCLNLGNGTTIGDYSCNGVYACDSAGASNGSSTIGSNSCNGSRACRYAGFDGGSATIGNGSCNGSYSCAEAGYTGTATIGGNSCNQSGNTVDDACYRAGYTGTATIGDNSCNDGDYANCYEAGSTGTATIGDNSCNNGDQACYQAGYNSGSATIGDYSCNNSYQACYAAGDTGSASIGDNSCNGNGQDYACFEAGRDGSATIGSSSCNDRYACAYSGKTDGSATIGSNSCNGDRACNYAGNTIGSATIGSGSCNGGLACSDAGFNDIATIGRYSCNQDDPPGNFKGFCAVTSASVGDCEYNDDPQLTPCVSVDFGVTKTPSMQSLPAGGGNVNFEIVVKNDDPFGITLNSLQDDTHGNLHGQGSCSVPQTITSGESYTCSYSRYIDADHLSIVTAKATDEVGNSGSRSDDARVDVAEAPPTPTSESERPQRRPNLGGAIGPILQGGAAATQANLERAAASGSPAAATAAPGTGSLAITPPSTGDGGLVDNSSSTSGALFAGLLSLLVGGSFVSKARSYRRQS